MSSYREVAMPETAMNGRTIKGHHVLIGLLAFFGVILAVNGVFLYEALSTHTGVVSNEPYRKGLAYNDRIAADKAQHALGWKEEIAIAPGGDNIIVALDDANGRPVSGLMLSGRLGRPSTEDQDLALEFSEKSPGRYAMPIPKIAAGSWQVDVTANELTATGERTVWRSRKRLWQAP